MSKKAFYALITLLVSFSMIISACATPAQAAPAPEDGGKYAAGITVCNNGHLTGESSAHGNPDKIEVVITKAQADQLNSAKGQAFKSLESAICTVTEPSPTFTSTTTVDGSPVPTFISTISVDGTPIPTFTSVSSEPTATTVVVLPVATLVPPTATLNSANGNSTNNSAPCNPQAAVGSAAHNACSAEELAAFAALHPTKTPKPVVITVTQVCAWNSQQKNAGMYASNKVPGGFDVPLDQAACEASIKPK